MIKKTTRNDDGEILSHVSVLVPPMSYRNTEI